MNEIAESDTLKACKMGITKDPPEFNSETPYEQYKLELDAWIAVTDVPKAKWGQYVALSLPANDPSDIRNKVFTSLMKEKKLDGDQGYTNLIAFLDEEFQVDEIVGVFNVFETFEAHKKESGVSMKRYISDFEAKYKEAKNKGFPELPQEYLMYKLIKSAGLAPVGEKLVQTEVDYTSKLTLVKNAKAGLLKYFGGDVKSETKQVAAAADDKAFLLNEGKTDEAFFGQYGRDRAGTFPTRGGGGGQNQWRGRSSSGHRHGGGYNQNGGNSGGGQYGNGQYGGGQSGGWRPYGNGQYQSRGGSNNGNNQSRGAYGGQNNGGFQGNTQQKKVNPSGLDGKPKTCASCQSIRHMVRDCPDSWENLKTSNPTMYAGGGYEDLNQGYEDGYQEQDNTDYNDGTYVTLFTHGSVLYTGDNEQEQILFAKESKNKVVVDTGCTATVSGLEWANTMVDSLSDKSKALVQKLPSDKIFHFGGGEKLKSIGLWIIPMKIAGQNVMLRTDVVRSFIPCLLSRKDLKAAGCHLDLVHDRATLFGRIINLDLTTAGHYAVQCLDPEMTEQVLIGQISGSHEDKIKRTVKLHKQFAHPKIQPFTQLLKDAGEFDEEIKEILEKIYSKCQICIEDTRTKARPVVGMPLARDFNECVAMDLKIHKEGNIYYLVDVMTRYTAGGFVKDKEAETIVRATLDLWNLGPFGPPKKFLADNGGEFANELYRDMCENFNIEVLKTGAASPFQNGICERNHAVVDNMFNRMRKDNPTMDKHLILSSCIAAKNALAMNNGFSPVQLVTGKTPNLPSALNDNPPALECSTSSVDFAERVNAAHQARQKFIVVDSSAKVRRALLRKIMVKHEVYKTGDRVFYKKGKDEKWHGVGKVIGVDGKVIFVKHGRSYVTPSPTRMMKANRVFQSHGDVIDQLGPVEIENEVILRAKRDPKRPPVRIQLQKDFRLRWEDEEDDDQVEIQPENARQQGAPEPVMAPAQRPVIPVVQPQPPEQQQEPDFPEIEDIPMERQNSQPERSMERQNSQRAGPSRGNVVYPKSGDKIECVINNQPTNIEIQGRGGKATGKNKSYFNVKYPDDSRGGLFLDTLEWKFTEENQENANEANTENANENNEDQPEVNNANEEEEQVFVVLVPRSMHHMPAIVEAKKLELKNFKDFKVYRVVMDRGQERLNHCWVITQKMFETGMGFKARLVACGNEENQLLRTDSPTIGKMTLKIILTVAAQLGWKIESGDVKAAFLQGQNLEREVHIVPPKEANEGNNLWLLLKPIYGLNDASRSFYLKLVEKLLELGCKRSKFDYAVFIYHQGSNLAGIIGGHVDDLTYAGTPSFFQKIIEPLKAAFKFGKMSSESFKYVGWSITHDGSKIQVDQDDYVNEKCEEVKVKQERANMKDELLNSEEKSTLRKVIGRGRWLTDQTRPDCAYDELELSMIVNKATVKDLSKANKMFRKMKFDRVKLIYQKVGRIQDIKITLFTDASFGNLPDGMSSAGGHIIFLSTGYEPGVPSPCCPITWLSGKLKRKVTNTMEAETLALREGLEEAIVVQSKMAEMLNCAPKNIRIEAFTDNDDCHKAIYSSKQMLKGRMLIDMGVIKDMVDTREVESVQWIDKNYQLADALTKTGASTKSLLYVLNTGHFPDWK